MLDGEAIDMKLQNMFGVVLWSDAAAQKAVIWCEDQGELAFYTPCDGSIHTAPLLDAGDLIQFEVTVQKNVRKASNPQVVMPSHSPDLPQKLRSGTMAGSNCPDLNTVKRSEKIVELARYFEVEPKEQVACSG